MFKVNIVQKNYFQIATAITDLNLLIELIFAEDPWTAKIHKIIHKTDIVDQIVRKTNIEIITKDQIQIDVITRTIEVVLIQTLGTDTILRTV